MENKSLSVRRACKGGDRLYKLFKRNIANILSLILFLLSVNPLSFLLEKHEGYKTSIDEKG